MLNAIGWIMFLVVGFFIFIQLYAWAAFVAFVLLMLMLRDMNTNLCELVAELKNQKGNI